MDEVLTDWTTPAGGGFLTVHYVAETVTERWRLKWFDFLSAIRGNLASGVTYSIRSTGRQVDAADGSLTGQWVKGTPLQQSGSGAATALPDSAQVLLRWRTGIVVNGRFAQGRTFLPGFTTAMSTNGNVDSARRGTMQTALNTLLTPYADSGLPAGLLVWTRPGPKGPGISSSVATADIWSEFAIQSGRRK